MHVLHDSTGCAGCLIGLAVQHAWGAKLNTPAGAHERQAEEALPACRGIQSGHHAKLIAEVEAAGAKVTISRLDVVDPEQAKELIALTEGIAPIAAIFHLAMVLDDRMLINQVPHPFHTPRASFTAHEVHAAKPCKDLPHPEGTWPHTRILLGLRACCTVPDWGELEQVREAQGSRRLEPGRGLARPEAPDSLRLLLLHRGRRRKRR